MLIHLTFIINLLFVGGNHGAYKETVDYYVNLITSEIKRASTQVIPNNAYDYRPLNNEDMKYGTFDHVVVGSGAAGAIVASRLSEDPSKTVLLIEAGIEETDFTDIPVMAAYASRLGYSWNYTITPQTGSCSDDPSHCFYNMGKGIGGSTIINGLVYSRGNARDYDNWYNQGNRGWAFKHVLPFFKKSENSKINGDVGYHGFGGNLNVEYTRPNDSVIVSMFLEANRELHRHIGDFNGRCPLTVGKIQLTTIEGRRGSTGRAFLRQLRNRKNLRILTESYATKILILNKKAYGVRFARRQQLFTATSTRDIIISAGTIGSPQLLMQSGIGPKSHLQELDIPVREDLSVGNFFKEHFYAGVTFVTNCTEPTKVLKDFVREYLRSEGPFTNTQILAAGFLQTNRTKFHNYPDVELMLIRPINVSGTFSIVAYILHPKSEGYIRLKSNDPFDYPIINPNRFSDEYNEDIETLYQEYKDRPACNNYEYLSKGYWYCRIRLVTTKAYHPIGTCKMGPDSSKGAVVDDKLKVHGIRNLRVADASIMPHTISGHTSAATMMIGEKAAHMIKYGS